MTLVTLLGAPRKSQTPVFREPWLEPCWIDVGVSDLLRGAEAKELQSRDLNPDP